MVKKASLVALLMCAWLLAGACGGGGSSKTIDTGDGHKVTLRNKLPDSFPGDFPIYDGADLQGAVEGQQEGIKGTVATWTTGDGLDKVKAFYDSAFGSGKWTSQAKGSASGSSFWSVENSSTHKVGYVAINPGDRVSIVAIVGDNPDQASGSSSAAAGDGSDGGDSASATISAGDGSSSTLPPAVALPSGFPKSTVPLPGDAHITSANTTSAGGAQMYSVDFYSKQTVEQLGAFFKSALEGKGYTQSVQTNDASGLYAAYAENSDGSGTVVVLTVADSDVTGYRVTSLQVSSR